MTMLPPGGGRNSVDPRFISQVTCYTMYESTEATKKEIYTSILNGHIERYWSGDAKLKKMSADLADITIDAFEDCTKKLARTPIKFH